MIFIQNEFKQGLKQNKGFFDQIMQIKGKIFRALENRKTLQFEQSGKSYFVKQHFGVGWKEIVKNLLQLRLPIISAKNEWRAVLKLDSLNIPTLSLVAYGERGLNPAHKQSFMVTDVLEEVVSLEEVCKNWSAQKPILEFKEALICEIAAIARAMHQHGMNHRDFYICHFLMKKDQVENLHGDGLHLILIDLHRTQIRSEVPLRWQIKDIAGLYFSSMDAGLTRRDIFRFLRIYFRKSLRQILKEQSEFIKAVESRAVKLYFKTFQRAPKS